MRLHPTLALPILLASSAAAADAPAHFGDFSAGLGPALVVDRGNVGGGAVAEGNLLFDWFSLGLHGRLASVSGEFRPELGLEAAAFGLVGAGVGIQEGGPSIDLSLSVPIPIYAWEPFYLAVGYRPSFLLQGGTVHEVAIQLKWSSLLLPSDD